MTCLVRIIRPGHIWLPIKHPVAVPMFAQADQQQAQLVQRDKVDPAASPFRDLFHKFIQAAAACLVVIQPSNCLTSSSTHLHSGGMVAATPSKAHLPTRTWNWQNLLLQAQLIGHRCENWPEVIGHDQHSLPTRCTSGSRKRRNA